MSAKNYCLAVTGLTNAIWICKQSKTNPHLMTDDRVKIEESTFIGIVLEWLNGKIEDDEDTLMIRTGGKVVAELKIDRVALGLKKAPKTSKKPGALPKPIPITNAPDRGDIHVSDSNISKPVE